MIFLLSCLLTYEADRDRTVIGMEQTKAVRHINYDRGNKSSVKITAMEDGLITGHGSGNYFKIGKERFIITAGHVIHGGSAFFIYDGDEMVHLETIHVDRYYDIAFMKPIRKLVNIKAVDYRVNKKQDILGLSVNYTGYPSDLPKTLFTGMISHSGIGFAIMQSFAVPGSSGSIVFDNSGRVVGVLNAVKVGMYGLSPFPHLEENVVFIERLSKFDRKKIRGIMELWRKLNTSP